MVLLVVLVLLPSSPPLVLGRTIALPGSTAIVVQDVHEKGAARKAGLHAGDKLLSVNQKSLVNVTHQEAVDLIKDAIPAQVKTCVCLCLYEM